MNRHMLHHLLPFAASRQPPAASRIVFAWLLMVVTITPVVRGELTAENVRRAIRRGADYLKAQQNRADGSWPEHPGQPGGMTAMCALALITAGEKPDTPEVQAALNSLRNLGPPGTTYATSLQTMVFCMAEPDKDRALISRNVEWLEQALVREGPYAGMWHYGLDPLGGDNSNTQFALLALYEAERVGVDVDPSVWQICLEHFQSTQHDQGSWSYSLDQGFGKDPTGSMTCAGLGSLLICTDRLGKGEARVSGGTVACCGAQMEDDRVERAIQWLGSKSLESNPGSDLWHFYYLYGIERVGRLSGRRFLGRLDWYREGAQLLLNRQDTLNGQWRSTGIYEDNPILATSFALLFLAKGRRPILISQVEWLDTSDDWNRHPASLHQLTRRVEQQWRRDLAWQTIRLKSASLDELMESPVLFFRGTGPLELTNQQKENLKEYVSQGGFLFAEACDGDGCDGEAFRKSFEDLMIELFPDTPLRELAPDHAVWFAEMKVDPRDLPEGMWLYGIDACCRTSVVLVNKTLSCYWELSTGRRKSDYPPEVTKRIEACLNLGQNILAYATNRELKDKLDRPPILVRGTSDTLDRGTLYVPKLSHTGGADDAPHSLVNLLSVLREQVEVRVNTQRQLISPTDIALYEHPVVFFHGRRAFRFTVAERQALAEYLRRGGFIFGDAICASPQFTVSVRREFEAMFPGSSFVTLPPEHPIYSQDYRGSLIDRVTVRDPQARVEGEPLSANLVQQQPLLEGLEVDGRLAVVFSPLDISCALENQSSLECKGYVKQDAARLGVNILLYALGQ